MPRVLLFVNHLERGGTETQLVHLANALVEDSDFEIHVACHRFGPLLEQLHVPRERIRAYPLRGFYRPNGLRQIARLAVDIRRAGFDLVHAQDFYANVMCAAACSLNLRPRLVVSRRYERRSARRVHRWGEWCSYRLADAVVLNSSTIEVRLTGTGFLPRRKAVVVPNGIELERFAGFRWHRDMNRFRPDARRRIGAVGRLHPVKGHEVLLHATAALADRWPGLELALVGDGECRGDLLRLAERLGIRSRVLFMGEIPDVRPLLPTFDVAVMPSYYEGLPNALLEYMAVGCPVVATEVGGIPDAVRNEHEALLVPPQNAMALAEAIDSLLRNPQRCISLSEAARIRVQEFAMPRMVAAIRELYTRLLGSGSVSRPTDNIVTVEAG
ncbi:MAG: glycosyltransferase [Gemmatimonadota bacterium]|nr:glycosyltransferase [Gemmatimonadota bacterium]